MRVSFRQRAGEHQRYAPDAFAASVGKQVRLSVDGEPAGVTTLVDAKVSDDGTEVTLTYDLPRGVGTMALGVPSDRQVGAMSLDMVFPPAERRQSPD